MAANENVVDGEVEVLDLAELEEALGGVARRTYVLDPNKKIDLKGKSLADLLGAIKKPVAPGPRVLIENDGWQGAAFEPLITPVLSR